MSGIPKEKQLEGMITKQEGKRFIIKTNYLSMSDITYFLGAIKKLKKNVKNTKVSLSVGKGLHDLFKKVATAYQFDLIDENNKDLNGTTHDGIYMHLNALLGYLRVFPRELELDQAMYSRSSEGALKKVKNMLEPHKKKRLCIVFLGQNEPITVMGGRQISHPCLNASAFEPLLKKDTSILLIDADQEENRIKFFNKRVPHLNMATQFQKRVQELPDTESSCDTQVALCELLNTGEYKFAGIGASTESAHIFAQTLSPAAQKNFAFIVPEGEYDVRMEGKGHKYKHMLTSCWVYQCSQEKQSEAILEAYKDMMSNK